MNININKKNYNNHHVHLYRRENFKKPMGKTYVHFIH